MRLTKIFVQTLTIQIFLFTLTVLAFNPTNTTSLKPPLERMLSRKKRFLLMPKGCHLKFTAQLSKRLLAAFPRGFNFVIEVALYYPAPTSRQDVIPKRLRKPTTTTPKPKGTKPPIFVCVPGSLFCWKAKPAAKPMKIQKIDENINQVQWIEQAQQAEHNTKYAKYGAQYASPQQWAQWTKYGDPAQYERFKWTSAKEKNYEQSSQQSNFNHPNIRKKYQNNYKWTTSAPIYPTWSSNNVTDYSRWSTPRFQQYQTQIKHQRWRRTLGHFERYFLDNQSPNSDSPRSSTEPLDFPDLEHFHDWQHYNSHRDRRQLYHQFEGLSSVFGFDLKACIMRAICESKRYLLPPGYSLIQDVLRVVFTLPTISGIEDDYSRAMHADYKTCNEVFKSKCAYNMLNWFLNPKQGF